MDRIAHELNLFVLVIVRIVIMAPLHLILRIFDSVIQEGRDTCHEVRRILSEL
jgi:hypothetical protein